MWALDETCDCIPPEGYDPCDATYEGAFTQADGTLCPTFEEEPYYDDTYGETSYSDTPWMDEGFGGASAIASATAALAVTSLMF